MAGCALPLVVTAAYLAAHGALDRALYDLFLWPARYYRESGGGPGDTFWGSVAAAFSARAGDSEPGIRDTADIGALGCALLLPALLVFLLALSPRWRRRERGDSPEAIAAATALVASLAFFLVGRRDWVHAALFLPFCLVAVVREIAWQEERARPVVLRAYAALGLAFATVFWVPTWAREKPTLSRVLAIDALYEQQGPMQLVKALDPRGEKAPAIVYLSEGSPLYFFWAPSPPPIDRLLPPSAGYNAPWEYEWLASFLEAEQIPYVFMGASHGTAYVDEPSALAIELRAHYRPVGEWRGGTVLGRID
jgi:hypothetical protein